MEIKIKSQTVNDPEELLSLITSSDNSVENYKITEIKAGTRPVISVAAIITGLSTLGIGGIVVALINAVKDYKIKKLELTMSAAEKSEDRKVKKEELIFSRETEILKLEGERKKIALNGYVEIVGNYVESMLKENKEDKKAILEKLGFKFSENTIIMPANIELNESVITTLEDTLELEVIKEVVHVEQN